MNLPFAVICRQNLDILRSILGSWKSMIESPKRNSNLDRIENMTQKLPNQTYMWFLHLI